MGGLPGCPIVSRENAGLLEEEMISLDPDGLERSIRDIASNHASCVRYPSIEGKEGVAVVAKWQMELLGLMRGTLVC